MRQYDQESGWDDVNYVWLPWRGEFAPEERNKVLLPTVRSCSKGVEEVMEFSFIGGPVGEHASCSLMNTNSKNQFLILKEN